MGGIIPYQYRQPNKVTEYMNLIGGSALIVTLSFLLGSVIYRLSIYTPVENGYFNRNEVKMEFNRNRNSKLESYLDVNGKHYGLKKDQNGEPVLEKRS